VRSVDGICTCESKGLVDSLLLSTGFGEVIAYEGALKIKEMSMLHAEGYSGGALKHGPFALIEDETGHFGATAIIMLILDDQHAHHMRTAAEEVSLKRRESLSLKRHP
jgi:glucosamine--fructose-6-phosphate aminotransferase (isomerizing)